ncbi:Long-chain fatty acid transport protein 4 [Halotydeus destructor]|nr:Long-chain fatty acid transport protein 4 [Halotydeus destructor]
MTGDLVMMDKYGYVYFRDRIGDTFRWKSENVSTTEVESILMKCLPLSDAVVYGVEIPACEGRAGMAAMLPSEGPEKLSVKSLYDRICTDLPSYAMPIFVRILDKVDLTGTFKFNKVALKRDSFDPQVTRDSIYYLDAKAKIYCHLTKDLYEDILNGQIRF